VQTLFAKEVSTHPTMVSTQQPRFKGKKIDAGPEQVDTGLSSQNSLFAEWDSRSTQHQSRSTLDLVPRTSCSQIRDSVSTPTPGQVDTLRKDCNLNWMFVTCQPRAMVYEPRIMCPYT
ncbi:hypothetical protein Taro_005747, partial [Colocasia esculenta]|nr:hypothetical protein [Colocasia esculenta]